MSIFEEKPPEPLKAQAWMIADNHSCGENLRLINSIAEALADAAAPRLGLIKQNRHLAAQVRILTMEKAELEKEIAGFKEIIYACLRYDRDVTIDTFTKMRVALTESEDKCREKA